MPPKKAKAAGNASQQPPDDKKRKADDEEGEGLIERPVAKQRRVKQAKSNTVAAAAAGAATATATATATDPTDDSAPEEDLPATLTMDDPQMLNTHYWKMWAKKLPKLTLLKMTPRFTPYKKPLRLQEMPIRQNRDFRPQTPKMWKVEVDGAEVRYYTITARNNNMPHQECILFEAHKPTGVNRNKVYGGILRKDSLCPDSATALIAARACCEVLNSYVFDVKDWQDGHAGSKLRRYTHIAGLLAIDANLDFTTIDPHYLEDKKGAVHTLHLTSSITPGPKGTFTTPLAASVFMTDVDITFDFQLDPKIINVDKVLNSNIAPASTWYWQSVISEEDRVKRKLTVNQAKATQVLFNYVRKSMHFVVGTKSDLTQFRNDLLQPYLTSQRLRIGGCCDSQKGWGYRLASTGNGERSIRPDAYAETIVKGTLPTLAIPSRSKVDIAFVTYKMAEAVRMKLGHLNVWQQCVVTIISLALRRWTHETIISHILERLATNKFFVCMSCIVVRDAEGLRQHEDGRLICATCAEEKELPDLNPVLIKNRLRVLIGGAARSDKLAGSQRFDELKIELTEVLDENIIDSKEGIWRDDYGVAGNSRKEGDASWSSQAWITMSIATKLMTICPHPTGMSVEVFDAIDASSTPTAYHSGAQDVKRVGLVPLYTNLAHGHFNVSSIPLLRKAAILVQAVDLPETDRAAELAQITNGFHHAYMIRSKVPLPRALRLNNQAWSKPTVDDYLAECRSGVWDGSFAADQTYFNITTLSLTMKLNPDGPRSELYLKILSDKPNRIEYTLWTQARIRVLLRLFKKIEEKYGFVIPRGKNDVPLIFFGQKMPTDWDWPDLFKFCRSKLWMMLEACDVIHTPETPETPDTICIVIIILICKGKGCDILFQLSMVMISRHPLRMSLGRDHTVDPKAPMKSGCKKGEPESLDDIEFEAISIAIEPWIVNLFKFRYPPEMIPDLVKDLIDNIAEGNDVFRKLPQSFKPVQFPSTLKDYNIKGSSQATSTKKYTLFPIKAAAEPAVEDSDEELEDDWVDQVDDFELESDFEDDAGN